MISRETLQLIVAFLKRAPMKGEETQAYNQVMNELAEEFKDHDARDKGMALGGKEDKQEG